MSLRKDIKHSIKISKVAKDSVDYSKAMIQKERCGLCEYYINGGKCEKVQGDIKPEYWCELFEPEGGD